MEHQIISIWLAGEGHFDNVPVEDIRRFEAELMDHLRSASPEVFEQIAGGAQLSEESMQTLVAQTEQFKRGFQTTDGTPVINEPEVDALPAEQVKKNTLTVKK